MKKSINTFLSLFFGIIICGILLTMGVMASRNFNSNFSVNLTFAGNVKCAIGLKINSTGQEYIIFNNTELGTPVSENSVASFYEDRENDSLILNLGSAFSNVIQSADSFYFTIYNFSSFALTSNTITVTSSDIAKIGNITDVATPDEIHCTANSATKTVSLRNSIVAYSQAPAPSGTIPVSVTVSAQTPMQFKLNIQGAE